MYHFDAIMYHFDAKMYHFEKKNSEIFSPEGPVKMFGGPRENVSPDPAVALDGLAYTSHLATFREKDHAVPNACDDLSELYSVGCTMNVVGGGQVRSGKIVLLVAGAESERSVL